MREVKALERLFIFTGSFEPSLIADVYQSLMCWPKLVTAVTVVVIGVLLHEMYNI